jgi:N4-gp56 family major capsid protein
VLGLHAAETYDQLIFNVLTNGTTVYLPNGRAGVTSLVASDLIGYNDLVQIEANMMDQGARPVKDGMYAFVLPPQVYAGLLKDPDWKASHQLRNPEVIWRGEVGALGGLATVRSNAPGFAPQAQSTSTKTNKWYYSFAIGRQAYAITDLQGLRVYTIAPGGHEDPLYQNRKISYKFAFKSMILNNNWLTVVKSSGQNSTNN